jgi:hypothetical protein
MKVVKLAFCGLAALVGASTLASAQDSISRMESRLANTTAVLSDQPTVAPGTLNVPMPPISPAPGAGPGPMMVAPGPYLNQNGGGACCDTGCGSNCGPRHRWMAGVEATYLFADLDDELVDIDGQTIDFERELEAAPRVWLGLYGPNGGGIRGRYWDYDSEASFADIQVDTDSQTAIGVLGASSLDASTYDIEVFRNMCLHGWDTTLALGARHAQIGYDFAGQQLDFQDDVTVDSSTTLLSRGFDGTGVTGAIERRRAIGCGGGLALYWNSRGSAVFGDNKASSLEVDSDVEVDASVDVDIDTDSSRESETLLIGELQVGLEMNRQLSCANASVIARAGFEYQIWKLENNDPLSDPADVLGNEDLNLYGPTVSIGIMR